LEVVEAGAVVAELLQLFAAAAPYYLPAVAATAAMLTAETVAVAAVQALPTATLPVLPEDITVVIVNPEQAQQVVVKLDRPTVVETMTKYHRADAVVITEPIMPGLVYTGLVPGHRLAETAMVLLQAVEPVDPLGGKDNSVVPADW
jgi:hypothetical protein